MDTIRDSVRARYAETAIKLRDGGSCCDSTWCGGSDAISGPIGEEEYSKAEVAYLGLSLDMTDEMLVLANENKARAGVENATFLKGTIEAIPLPDAAVDVVISNCVINLAPDKAAVLKEAFRVLKPGGRFAVSDMVELEPLAAHVKSAMDSWAGCVAGTIPVEEYRAAVVEAGFDAVEIEVTNTYGPGEAGLPQGSGKIASAFIRAAKP
jgi:arsenite methyltransferase